MKLRKFTLTLLITSFVLASLSGCKKENNTVEEAVATEETKESALKSDVDYSIEENWAYFGIGEGKEADLFLICPTVDMNDEYNMSMDDEETKANFLGALNMERGIYEDSTRMYAPYYRQAAMKVYGEDRTEWEPYMQIAYSDVSAASSYYLENENDGRPIFYGKKAERHLPPAADSLVHFQRENNVPDMPVRRARLRRRMAAAKIPARLEHQEGTEALQAGAVRHLLRARAAVGDTQGERGRDKAHLLAPQAGRRYRHVRIGTAFADRERRSREQHNAHSGDDNRFRRERPVYRTLPL